MKTLREEHASSRNLQFAIGRYLRIAGGFRVHVGRRRAVHDGDCAGRQGAFPAAGRSGCAGAAPHHSGAPGKRYLRGTSELLGTLRRDWMRLAMAALLLCVSGMHAQDKYDGLWQGYDGEWRYVSRQLEQLAEAIPAEKYGWRPGPGVRSVSEVIMHIAIANYGLLAVTGVKLPAGAQARNSKDGHGEAPSDRVAEALTGHGQDRALERKARRSYAQDQERRLRFHCGRHVSTDHRSRQRAYGTVGGLRQDERDRASLVEIAVS